MIQIQNCEFIDEENRAYLDGKPHGTIHINVFFCNASRSVRIEQLYSLPGWFYLFHYHPVYIR